MKTRVLLLLCRFWRTKQLVIFHKLIVIKIKKTNQYIDSTRHILTINIFQDNQYQADRRLHRTNDPHMLSSLQATHRLSHLRLLYSFLHARRMFSRDNSHFCFGSYLVTVPTNMVAYLWNTDRKAVIIRILDALEVAAAPPESAMQATRRCDGLSQRRYLHT